MFLQMIDKCCCSSLYSAIVSKYLFVFTSNNFIVSVQTLLSDIIHERKYKINDGVRIRYDFSSGYANFDFELTGEGATGPESNVSTTIAF